jgi:hypothetical protein
MTEQPEIVETIEPPTDDDIAAFVGGGGNEGPSYHTILEVWQKVLEPAEADSKRKVGMPWAMRIIAEYREITFAQVNLVRDRYHEKLADLIEILDVEIDSDPQCFEHTTAEEDREHNGHHYLNLLTLWQFAFVKWEHEWDVAREDAAIEIAALSEAQKMFFGDTGLTQHLDNIQLQFTQEDQEDLGRALQEYKASLDDGLVQ